MLVLKTKYKSKLPQAFYHSFKSLSKIWKPELSGVLLQDQIDLQINEKTLIATSFTIRTTVMARILLFLWSIHTKFRQNRRKPNLQANKMVKKRLIFLSMEKRQNRIPVHRCNHDPTSRIGVDPSSRPSRSRLLPHKRRPLCFLVKRQISFLKIAPGC